MKTLYYTDVVFGNESELQKLGEGCFKTKNLEEIMYKMANLPKANMTRERIVIITNGCHPVLYVQGKEKRDLFEAVIINSNNYMAIILPGKSFYNSKTLSIILSLVYRLKVKEDYCYRMTAMYFHAKQVNFTF